MTARRRRASVAFLAVAVLAATSACSSVKDVMSGSSATSIGGLPPAARVDDQTGGGYPPADGVRIVLRPRTDDPVKGRYNVCAVNAFQVQRSEPETWHSQDDDLLLRDASGQYVEEHRTGETLLDISNPDIRRKVLTAVSPWLDACAQHGFQAVELDDLDSYTRSGGRFTADDAVEYATLLATRAHAEGLAVAQRDVAQLVPRRKDIDVDFAIADDCQVAKNCDAYTSVFGSAFVEIEHSDVGTASFAAACAARGTTASLLLRDRRVLPAGSPGYVNRYCGA